MHRVLLFFFLISLTVSFGQNNAVIEGNVINERSSEIKNVEVLLVELNLNTFTDKEGKFSFENLPHGVYTLIPFYEGNSFSPGYADLRQTDFQEITLTLEMTSFDLEEVRLQAKSRSEQLKTSAIKAEIIAIGNESQRANSVEDLVNRAPGIKIRNVGGLGSASNVLVGGFTGNAIKFLYDDIPMDYLGSNYGLTKVPSNTIERVEIYKGVLPTKLGIDALGSAINIVPKTFNKTSGTISYEFGSFGTHIGTINATAKITDQLFIGTNSFYNYSKNNYKVDDLPYRDPVNGHTTYIRERLFHNAFEQLSIEVFIQGRGLSWADWIELKINSYDLSRDIQNDPYTRARPFGEVYRTEKGSFIPSLKYKKYFLEDRLNLNQFLVLSNIEFELVDRAKNVYYDWKGQAHPNTSGSEMGNFLLENGYLNNKLTQFTSRTNLNYLLNDQFQIESNTIFSHFNRKSNVDELNPKGTDYNKLISNLGLNGIFFENKLESNSQIKFLYSHLSGKYENSEDPTSSKIEVKEINNKGWSFSQAFKYTFNSSHFVRISYENTFRLPEQRELFGDNNFIVANYDLRPEKSNNINLGYSFSSEKWNFETNTYYRNTKDLIRLKDLNQYEATFLNLDHVRGYGVELEAAYQPIPHLNITGNITWNDFRLESSRDPFLNNQHFKNARVANLPFYYGNTGVSYNFIELLNLNHDLTFFWDYSYVHQYYLDFIEKQFEPDGFLGLWGQSKINTSRIIPVQHLNNFGMVYSRDMGERSLSFSAEVKNIYNSKIYNEFKMQSPGRNYRFKITYTF